MLFNHRYKKASLVPVSCWATIRKGNSISADFTEDTIENYYNDTVSAIFRQIGICFGYFVGLFDIAG